ncbi:MAG: hypothetical protein II198_03905, partial [Bacteroidaceae bacterium]|nr:hypothetical protein [Bacteroidaceae bacterium]
MKRATKSIRRVATIALVALTQCLAGCWGTSAGNTAQTDESAPAKEEKKVVMKYNLPIEDFIVT